MVVVNAREQQKKLKEQKEIAAQTWAGEADSSSPLPKNSVKDESRKLIKHSIRLHPKMMGAIEKRAMENGVTYAALLRSLLIKGMKAEGLEM